MAVRFPPQSTATKKAQTKEIPNRIRYGHAKNSARKKLLIGECLGSAFSSRRRGVAATKTRRRLSSLWNKGTDPLGKGTVPVFNGLFGLRLLPKARKANKRV